MFENKSYLYLSLEEMLARMRARNWRVAVHNDYDQDGEFRTFWLFTHNKSGRFLKGEDTSDLKAVRHACQAAERLKEST